MCQPTRCCSIQWQALKCVLLSLAVGAATESRPRHWYDDLPNVKVLHPDEDNQALVDEIFRKQNNSHFGKHRFALLLTPGDYKEPFGIRVSYYTSVIGVGKDPSQVKLSWVESPNGANGHATNNFWRSVEGVTLWSDHITWAVSQAAPIRRSVIEGSLHLSQSHRFSSGGFMANVQVHGDLSMGSQQQWFFRNVDLWAKMNCPAGWNYVFVGMRGLSPAAQRACAGATPGKVVSVPLPWVAEKPFLVLEGDVWYIHVPKFVGGVPGATTGRILAWKLVLEDEVFITRPGMTAKEINQGMNGKKGLLVTPGVYELKEPIVVKDDHFVVLGIGFPTLIALEGRPAVQVANGLQEVRIAGLLLEAGTPMRDEPTAPLFQWGTEVRKEYVLPGGVAGLVADIFVRVGSFAYRGCPIVRADTMMEINSNDVVIDHVWLWHADHDDCGTTLQVVGKSDSCTTSHGLVVNGRRVTGYGLAAEHTNRGSMLVWNGEEGDVYFYQSEVPYHQADWGSKGFAGYVVAPHVMQHKAHGIGVYIISSLLLGGVRSAFLFPEYANIYNLFNVTIGGANQFRSLACVQNSNTCYGPQRCTAMRCWSPAFPHVELPPAKVKALEEEKEEAKMKLAQEAKKKLAPENANREREGLFMTKALHWTSGVQSPEAATRDSHGAAAVRLAAGAQLVYFGALPLLCALGLYVVAARGLSWRRRTPAARPALLPSDDEVAGIAPCTNLY